MKILSIIVTAALLLLDSGAARAETVFLPLINGGDGALTCDNDYVFIEVRYPAPFVSVTGLTPDTVTVPIDTESVVMPLGRLWGGNVGRRGHRK